MTKSINSNRTQAVVVGLAMAAIASIILYFVYQKDSEETSSGKVKSKGKSRGLDTPTGKGPAFSADDATPQVSNVGEEKTLHLKIEELDRKGKSLFKEKKFLEAAQAFTEALELIEAQGGARDSTSLARQVITLTNNRSAMYEKGGFPDLALEDCRTILEQDQGHTKARMRRLRILESQNNIQEALVEVCALQLRFMQENREKLRMGIPVSPPVSQSKLEEFLQVLLPREVTRYSDAHQHRKERVLPSKFTLTQLLRSFSGYHAWMAAAVRDGNVQSITYQLKSEPDIAKKATYYLKRGRRHAYDQQYQLAVKDFEAGLALVDDKPELQSAMEEGDFASLLEWVGMVRHWQYDLDGSLLCYDRSYQLDDHNVGILVKQAGVKMDGGKHDEALTLFETALALDPNTTDALLHRANLYMLRQDVGKAKGDLERLLELRPDHILARLRLATVLMAANDMEGTKNALDKAEEIAPDSSEVHSYRGEMYFAQGQIAEAKKEFDKAMLYEKGNPTPYVNAALAIMNTVPVGGGLPDAAEAIRLLEIALDVDPQFHAAYVHLGQLKLSMATDLTTAREVIKLYDRGLEFCRSPEEIKDLCGMRILTVAQVEAATTLKMETFSMQ